MSSDIGTTPDNLRSQLYMFCACAHDQTVSPDQDQQTLRILLSNFQVSFTMTVNTATEM